MKKRSWSIEQLKEAVKNNNSMRQTLLSLGLSGKGGGSSRYIKIILQQENIDITHWYQSKTQASHQKNTIPLEKILIKNSTYTNTQALKQRLVKAELLEYSCWKCKLKTWQNEFISLHLDHINGIHTDNRLVNLRLLCPNCHSQTETYGSKNIKLKKKRINYCNCNVVIGRNSTTCKKCRPQNKIIWPKTSDLLEKLKTMSYVALGKQLGVSDNAIRKRIKNYI